MLSLFVTFLLFSSVFGRTFPSKNDLEDRVVGGQEVNITDVPWQVALLRLSGGVYFMSCGGAIISSRTIVSGAGCPIQTDASQWWARAGSTDWNEGGQLLQIDSYLIHESFDGVSVVDYDISLFFTKSAFFLDGITVRAVALPVQGQVVADGTPAVMSGWGSTEEGGIYIRNLLKGTAPTVSQSRCVTIYAAGGQTVTPRMICVGRDTGGVGPCYGDAGIPLTIDGLLIGIASWGFGCARPLFPAIWTRVPAFRQWIDAHIII